MTKIQALSVTDIKAPKKGYYYSVMKEIYENNLKRKIKK